MLLKDIIDNCAVRTVTVAPEVSLAMAVQAMHHADAAAVLVMEHNLFQGILTAADILRALTSAEAADRVWNGPVRAALVKEQPVVTAGEKVTRVIERVTAAGIEYLPVIAGGAIRVVSLCRLLGAQNTHLHGELNHLQNYIDALHDAPND
jgi:CBS domain-containing protein